LNRLCAFKSDTGPVFQAGMLLHKADICSYTGLG